MVKFRFYDPDDEPTPAKAPAVKELVKEPVRQPVYEPAKKKGIVLDWHDELGWSANPFTRQAETHEPLASHEEEKRLINMFFVKHGHFGTMRGSPGSGMSTILRWLAQELGGYKERYTILLLDASLTQEQFCKEVMRPFETAFNKPKQYGPETLKVFLEGKLKKQLVVLVDDADKNERLIPCYKALLAIGVSVILAGVEPPVVQSDELRLRLKQLNNHDIHVIVERRIRSVGGSGIQPFTQSLIDSLWKASEHNIDQFFHFCAETSMRIALKEYTPPQEKNHAAKEESEPSKKRKESEKKSGPKSEHDDLIEKLLK